MDKRFIKIGSRIFAVAHIIALYEATDRVKLWTVADDEPWIFTGEEARMLVAWAKSMLHCQDLMHTPEDPYADHR